MARRRVKVDPDERICLKCRWWGRAAECFYPMNGRPVQGFNYKGCKFFEPYIPNFFADNTYRGLLDREIGLFEVEPDEQ